MRRLSSATIFASANTTKRRERQRFARYSGRAICVDAGANIGYLSLVMQSCGAKVIAIEPNRQLIGLLLGNVGGFCDVYRCALSDVDGEAPFYLPSKWESGWGSLAAADKGDRSRPVTVQTRRLDSILPEGPIRLIKMDVEGAEMPGFARTRRPIEGRGSFAHRMRRYSVARSSVREFNECH